MVDVQVPDVAGRKAILELYSKNVRIFIFIHLLIHHLFIHLFLHFCISIFLYLIRILNLLSYTFISFKIFLLIFSLITISKKKSLSILILLISPFIHSLHFLLLGRDIFTSEISLIRLIFPCPSFQFLFLTPPISLYNSLSPSLSLCASLSLSLSLFLFFFSLPFSLTLSLSHSSSFSPPDSGCSQS